MSPRPAPASVPNISVNTVKQLTQIRTYELLTPLMGGGVETLTNDPVTLIRTCVSGGVPLEVASFQAIWRTCMQLNRLCGVGPADMD
jgi:hypothetical protein